MKVWAVVVAAGRGTRFGGPKHLLELDGVQLWQRSADVFGHHESISGLTVVGDVPGGVPGGLRRRDSVASGLKAVPADTDWVLVHDAARPLVTVALIDRVLDAIRPGVDGVIPAVPVTDTLKQVDRTVVVGTVDRSDLVRVQTPQAFKYTVLTNAHAIDGEDDVTDDAALVERIGGTVAVVEGDPENMKVTFDGDLELAGFFLARRT
jgi:2-C-methyl-D-erythritol 4-phosphate cytidylyltransferase